MKKHILALQPADGLWRTSLLAPENFNHGEVGQWQWFSHVCLGMGCQ